MPTAKPLPSLNSKVHNARARDTTTFEVEMIHELIRNIGPKRNDKLQFEVVYAIVASISILTQFLHLYKLVSTDQKPLIFTY